MAKELFGFRIIDNDRGAYSNHEEYMFYTLQGKILVPTCKRFLEGFSPMSYDEAIVALTHNKIKEVTTFDPDSDRVASLPYEIVDEDDFRACEEDGLWYRFHHEEIIKGSKLEKLIKESNISLKVLSQEEKETLNEKLRDYPD